MVGDGGLGPWSGQGARSPARGGRCVVVTASIVLNVALISVVGGFTDHDIVLQGFEEAALELVEPQNRETTNAGIGFVAVDLVFEELNSNQGAG